MRKWIVGVMLVLAMAFSGSAAMAQNTADAGGSMVGGSVSVGTISECCRIAKAAYLASVQQPPSATAILNAAAAVRATLATGVVDRLLAPYWTGPTSW